MKNILFLVLDGLSKFYIDKTTDESYFLKEIEREFYSAENMFSTAPFTEGAIEGLLKGKEKIISGWSYMVNNNHHEKNIFDAFFEKGYDIYTGKFTPFFSHGFYHNTVGYAHEDSSARAFSNIWRNRINYFIKKADNLTKEDIEIIRYILDSYFGEYFDESNSEWKKYSYDKDTYIKEIIEKKEKSSFYKMMDSSLYEYRNIQPYAELQQEIKEPLTDDELYFCRKVRNKNNERMMKWNEPIYGLENLQDVLSSPINRCMRSNEDISKHLRDSLYYRDSLPKLKKELDDFIVWYKNKKEAPFFAYIHNMNFHYKENFTNSNYNDGEQYQKEILNLIKKTDELEDVPMSISRQLSLYNIDRNLKEFYGEIKKLGFFEDSSLVITADHGLSNFFYPVRRKTAERWGYLKTNFQVPFYIIDSNVEKTKDYKFKSLASVPETLLDLSNDRGQKIASTVKKEADDDYLVTSWINGIPDLLRVPVKYGVRNAKYSLTIEARYSQFLFSGEVIGLYDLEKDPDELFSQPFCYENKGHLSMMKRLNMEWLRIVKEYLIGEGVCKVFKSKKSLAIQKNLDFIKSYNENLKPISIKEIFKLGHRKIIVYGTDEIAKRFLLNKMDQCELLEIWDDNKINGEFFMGRVVTEPNDKWIADEIPVVIASINEIEKVAILNELGYNKVYLSSMICK